MPWIIASQAVPVVALAPIVIVALGTLGLEGLLPKAVMRPVLPPRARSAAVSVLAELYKPLPSPPLAALMK